MALPDIVANGKMKVGKTYYLRNKMNPAYALNVWCSNSYPTTDLSNACLWTYDSSDGAQRWKLIQNGSHYALQSVENPLKYLDRYTGSGAGNGINAHLYGFSTTAFVTIDIGTTSNSVRIKSESLSGRSLAAASLTNGTRLGKTASSSGNVYFEITNPSDMKQEWIPVEVPSYVWPTVSHSVSRYNTSSHDGMDINPVNSGVEGDEIYAYADGYVSFVGNPTNCPNEGYTVRIHHINPLDNSYSNIRTQYMHLNGSPLVSPYKHVQAGELIGYMGNTGNSTGVHLHFEVRGGTSTQFPLGGNSSNGFNTGTVLNAKDYTDIT